MTVSTQTTKELSLKALAIAGILSILSACALPQTTVRTGSAQPSLLVKNAPAGTVIYVDGVAMGPAPQFDGNPTVLAVLEGAHQVEVRRGTSVIYHEKIFVSNGETHPIVLLPGAPQ